MNQANERALQEQQNIKNIQQQQQYTEVYVWGDDEYGQLGLGHKYHSQRQSNEQENSRRMSNQSNNINTSQDQRRLYIPKSCTFQTKIQDVACGEDHACLLTSSGHVYSMGNNQFNKLGVKNLGSNAQICPKNGYEYSNTPKLVELLINHKIIQVSCGLNHSACVTNEGLCFGWGQFEFGQLGIGRVPQTKRNDSSNQQGAYPSLIDYFGRSNINISNISCGGMHTLFLTNRGNVYCCGSNEFGQLGIPQQQNLIEYEPKVVTSIGEEDIVQIEATYFNSYFLTRNGMVYSMGDNAFGQLGIGQPEISKRDIPIRINTLANIVKISAKHHPSALTQKGQVLCWGTGAFGQLDQPKPLMDPVVVDVSVGGSFGVALHEDGTVWTWGSNSKGQLGLGDFETKKYPHHITHLKNKRVFKIACGGSFAIAIGQSKDKPQTNNSKNLLNQQQIMLDPSHSAAYNSNNNSSVNFLQSQSNSVIGQNNHLGDKPNSFYYQNNNDPRAYPNASGVYEIQLEPVNMSVYQDQHDTLERQIQRDLSNSNMFNSFQHNSSQAQLPTNILIKPNSNFMQAEKENNQSYYPQQNYSTAPTHSIPFQPYSANRITEDRINKVIENLHQKQLSKKRITRECCSKTKNRINSGGRGGALSSKSHSRKRSTSTKQNNRLLNISNLDLSAINKSIVVNNLTALASEDKYNQNVQLDKTVQKVLNREREYMEDMLMREKRENELREEVIRALRRENEQLKEQLGQMVQLNQQMQDQIMDQQEPQKKKRKTKSQGVQKSAEKKSRSPQRNARELSQDEKSLLYLQIQQERKEKNDLQYLLSVKDQELKSLNSQIDKLKEQSKSQLSEKEQDIQQLKKQLQDYETKIEKNDQIQNQLQQLNQRIEQENQVLKNQKQDYSNKFDTLNNEMSQLKQLVVDIQLVRGGQSKLNNTYTNGQDLSDHQNGNHQKANESTMSFAQNQQVLNNNNNNTQLLNSNFYDQTGDEQHLYFKTSLSNNSTISPQRQRSGKSPNHLSQLQHDANSTVRDILKQNIKMAVANSAKKRRDLRLQGEDYDNEEDEEVSKVNKSINFTGQGAGNDKLLISKISAALSQSLNEENSRLNRFQRPERNLVQEIQDQNIKISEELLNKSANKLLQIMRTPNRKSASEMRDNEQNTNKITDQQLQRKNQSPYSNKSLVQQFRRQQDKSVDQKQSKYSLSDHKQDYSDASKQGGRSKLQNLSEMFQSSKLSQLFKKPAFYSSIRNNSTNNPGQANKENSAVKSPNNPKYNQAELSIDDIFINEDKKAKSQNYRITNTTNKVKSNSLMNSEITPTRKKESIEEFKAKLVRLERNKNDLESKMKEFEDKIRASNNRLTQSNIN